MDNIEKARILLYSHELSYTGAPQSLFRIARILKKQKYYVEIWSMLDGALRKEIEKAEITVKIVPEIEIFSLETVEKITEFDMAIANTVVTQCFYEIASELIPTVWFIREAQNLPEMCDSIPLRKELLSKSPDLYCVSEYAKEFIQQTYNPSITVLHNCVEDFYDNQSNEIREKVNIIAAGSFIPRKAFDICYDAFDTLPKEIKSKAHLYFVGGMAPASSNYWKPLIKKIKHNPDTTYCGEVENSQEKISLFKKMNVFVVPSLDESCSLVVLEGAMLGKPIIVSENVGAKYMVDKSNGIIVETGSVESLRNAFTEIIENANQIKEMGAVSREKYLTSSTIEIYEKSVIEMVENKLREKKIPKQVSFFEYLCCKCEGQRNVLIKQNEMIAYYENSTSWRITKPLRTLMDLIKSKKPR